MKSDKKFHFSQENIKRLIEEIYAGTVTPTNLDEDLYIAVADYLEHGLYQGFGKTLGNIDFESPDYKLLAELRENLYMFSAAKDFQMTLEMSNALTNEKDEVVSFSDFKDKALDIFTKYNGGENAEEEMNFGWLQTEYNTAIAQAQNAAKWNEIEKSKEALPMLTYRTAEDDTVCEICEPFDGVTLPVDDPFWDDFYPANHFGCFCIVEQSAEDEVVETSDEEYDAAMEHGSEEVPDVFKFNAGKDRVIFNDAGESKHPYFEVEKQYKQFALSNFNLPIPKPTNT